jgi:hypothetical protein
MELRIEDLIKMIIRATIIVCALMFAAAYIQ